MQIILNFPHGWWIQLLILYGVYISLFLLRKSYRKPNEVRQQLAVATICLGFAIIAEMVGINLHLWTYFPGNWPIMVWIGYFSFGLLAYQCVKLVEEKGKN